MSISHGLMQENMQLIIDRLNELDKKIDNVKSSVEQEHGNNDEDDEVAEAKGEIVKILTKAQAEYNGEEYEGEELNDYENGNRRDKRILKKIKTFFDFAITRLEDEVNDDNQGDDDDEDDNNDDDSNDSNEEEEETDFSEFVKNQ